MLISNDFNDNNFELLMDDTILKIVETHKHLQVGVHLSSNNKWSKHNLFYNRVSIETNILFGEN